MLLEARGPSWRVDRAAFDGWIAAKTCRAAERVDAKVSTLKREADGWSVDCDDGNSHSARLIIDATGRSRALAHHQGWRATAQDHLIAAYAEATTSGPAAPELLVEAFDDGWWYTMALGEGRRAFACTTDADLARGLKLNTPDGWRAAMPPPSTATRRGSHARPRVYAMTLGEHYGSVSRWAGRPFWQRRRADNSSSDSVSSLSEQ